MRKKYKILVPAILIAGLMTAAVLYLRTTNIAVLNPKGPIAMQERNLIIFAASLSLVVIVPVFTLLIVFSWKYRETNPHSRAKYKPDWDHSRLYETIWWVVPSLIIVVLSVVTWNSSHQLDPFKPLGSNTKPITIQVVALDWKWLFIYPQQGVASVNFFQIPTKTPINFELTADAPMNSFWIPQLAGQIYAMPGMSTQLHLSASVAGDFNGSSANISGNGFSGMTFIARASSKDDYNQWISRVKNSSTKLNLPAYNKLAEPSSYNTIAYYTTDKNYGLYDTILDKYMVPGNQMSNVVSSDQIKTMAGMSGGTMQRMETQ